jgi:hypothetical protein
MASPGSETDICNLALQRLGAKAISTLSEDSAAGRECNRIYEHARDSELRAHPWNFARARVALAADSVTPAFGFANQFPLPSDFLRILPDVDVTDWQIEGGSILTDDAAPLQLIYIKRVTDVTLFDELFIELLVSRIAVGLAEKLTQSNTKLNIAHEQYKLIKAEAMRVNSFENTSRTPPVDEWVTARL